MPRCSTSWCSRWTAKGDGVKRRVTEVLWIHEGQGFLINLIARDEAHDAQAANFAQIVASFAFLEK